MLAFKNVWVMQLKGYTVLLYCVQIYAITIKLLY